MKMWKYLIVLGLGFVFNLSAAEASTDNESFFDESEISIFTDVTVQQKLTPADIYQRTQSVLEHYKVPALPSSQTDLAPFSGKQSSIAIQKLLPFIDPQNQFTKLFNLSVQQFAGYDDINGKTQKDFLISLHSDSYKYKKVRGAVINAPLRGLRVAIDPGHMGESPWDKMTGKYVYDGKGNYLSEGIMALQVSLLLKQELEALGAQVVLTRSTPAPSTQIPYNDFALEPYILNEIRESTHQPWFQQLLGTGTGVNLFKAFDNSSQIKKMFSQNSKSTYYTLREDLWARADIINEFKPDITLIVHFDILPSDGDGHGLNAKAPNQTKVFIAGGFQNGELASRRTRKQFAKKLLDQKQWDESILLSKHVLNEFNRQMGLTFPKSSAGGTYVAPGIFSRNLGLTRSIDNSAIAYLECLFYNRPDEFYAFSQAKHPMVINGVNYPYSDRLKQVVSSIKQGVINYANDQ